jgi:hypothetical protein
VTTTTSNAGRKTINTSLHGRQVGLGAPDSLGAQPLINRGEASSVNFSVAPGAANIALMTIQLADNEGKAVAGVQAIDVWLADDAAGTTITATTASGAVAAGASGTDLAVMVTKKMIRALTDSTGKYILSITDTAKTTFYVAATMGRHTAPKVSAILATANYG